VEFGKVNYSQEIRRFAVVVAPILFVMILSTLDLFQEWFHFDEAQEISFTILIIAATLWISEGIPLFITSFIIVFLQIVWLLPAINHLNAADKQLKEGIFLSPFFTNIILLFLGGFVLSSVLHKYGLDRRMATWILKKTGSSPAKLLMAIILISAWLSMWMSNTATTAMMFAIILPIVAQIPEDNKFSKALVLSIPFACNLGGIGTPIGTPPNAIALSFLEKNSVHISFLDWITLTFPFLLVFLPFLWFMLLKIYNPGDLKIVITETVHRKMNTKHYIVLGVFVITCLGWVTTSFHPLSTGMVALIPVIICFGGKLLNAEDFRGLSWDVLFMLGGGLTLGVGLQASGLTEALVSMIPEQLGSFTLFAIFALVATLMTTFMSNTATANLIVPIAISIGAIGNQTNSMVLVIALMCSTAMALPVSTPPNAIAFSSGILHVKDMVIPGVILSVFAIVLVLIVGPFYWGLLGIF